MLLVLTVSWPQLAAAFTFNRHFLITDEDMTTGLFSRDQTVSFLRTKGGYLGTKAEEFGQIVYDAAVTNGLNPQFLLVQIQKESSLVEDPNPSQQQIDYALGFGCPDNQPCNSAYRGFGTQVSKAAAIFKQYLADIATTGRTISGWGVGIEKRSGAPRNKSNPNDPGWESIDGQPVMVTPQNAATAALYTYNPWVGGHSQLLNGRVRYIGANYNFRLIWDRYFVQQRLYPDGSLLRPKGGKSTWLIKGGKRHEFLSTAAFLANYDPRKVITVPPDELLQYDLGPGIKFAEFSLLQAPNGGVYLLANGTKRPIVSRQVFRSIGFNPDEIIKVSWDDLAPYPNGEKIIEATKSPTGKLVQVLGGGIAYVDENNLRHAVYSKEILRSQFRHRRWKTIKPEAFAALGLGEPVKFRDGELVTSPNAGGVFLIANGQKRPIPSREVFAAYRFSWRNVVRTSDRALEIHATGAPLEFTPA